jgi:hypothetical protein
MRKTLKDNNIVLGHEKDIKRHTTYNIVLGYEKDIKRHTTYNIVLYEVTYPLC